MQGRNGAVCVIALAERGALFDPGPCMYMEKLAVGPAVDPTSVDLNKSIKENLEVVAKALNKPIGYVVVKHLQPHPSVLLASSMCPATVFRSSTRNTVITPHSMPLRRGNPALAVLDGVTVLLWLTLTNCRGQLLFA